jgi:hypothetical protein
MTSKKGQSFSFDAIVAAIIFIVAIFSFFNFLLFYQGAYDYKKDIMDKEMIKLSTLLMSNDSTYGIMDSVTANRMIAEDDTMNTRIANVDDTTPYSLCVKIYNPNSKAVTYHPSNCNEGMQGSSTQTRAARIVQTQNGDIVSMIMNLYDKPSG